MGRLITAPEEIVDKITQMETAALSPDLMLPRGPLSLTRARPPDAIIFYTDDFWLYPSGQHARRGFTPHPESQGGGAGRGPGFRP